MAAVSAMKLSALSSTQEHSCVPTRKIHASCTPHGSETWQINALRVPTRAATIVPGVSAELDHIKDIKDHSVHGYRITVAALAPVLLSSIPTRSPEQTAPPAHLHAGPPQGKMKSLVAVPGA